MNSAKIEDLKPGVQIAYIPAHCMGDLNHRLVEFGFVTSANGSTAFCRYWSKINPHELRTKANSEGTMIWDLYLHTSHNQEDVDAEMKEINVDVDINCLLGDDGLDDAVVGASPY